MGNYAKSKLLNYKKLINNATTKEELTKILNQAFLQDDDAYRGNRTLFNKVVTLCVQRESELSI